nr:MAG TPA: hypothetical protein [Caudoviricetes sp.]
MLKLHRMQRVNEFMRCHASGEILMYGDFYYTNDDGKVISAKYYHNMKEQRRRETFDSSILESAQSQKEYQDTLRQAEQELLSAEMLDDTVETKFASNYEKEARHA